MSYKSCIDWKECQDIILKFIAKECISSEFKNLKYLLSVAWIHRGWLTKNKAAILKINITGKILSAQKFHWLILSLNLNYSLAKFKINIETISSLKIAYYH